MADPKFVAPDDPLKMSAQFVKGVGPSRFELLRRLKLETVGDLLFFFPRAYEDLSDLRDIAHLAAGKVQTAVGEVVEINGRTTSGGKDLVSIVISDGNQVLEGVWFNQSYIAQKFHFGQRVSFSGKPEKRYGHWQMTNPRFQFVGNDFPVPLLRGKPGGVQPPDEKATSPAEMAVVLPIYPLTEGLRPEQMRKIMRAVVPVHAGRVPEILPEDLLRKHRLPDIAQAMREVHAPATMAAANRARKRLVYEEFLVLQVALALRRRDVRDRGKAPVLRIARTIDTHIRRLFPFDLTADQNRAIAEICQDLASDRPMQRLLQADVGAGKTAVAVYALLLAVAHKHQAVLMAPTEVLARQHWRTLSKYLENSRVRKELLTGGLTPKQRKTILGEIRMGKIDLVVGTQAIIQKDVQFARLGLVVIDEQHRFGVAQRAKVRRLGDRLGESADAGDKTPDLVAPTVEAATPTRRPAAEPLEPHYLVMTATPIPRTMALTVFGDLDVSIIHEMPPGRKPVITRWGPEAKRLKLEEHLRKRLREGRQLYVVCPLVEESEPEARGQESGFRDQESGVGNQEAEAGLDIQAAERMFEHLRDGPFKDFKVDLLHGRMSESAKDRAMTQFRKRETDVLVSTSVIEVGVDVPNATLMVIERADRFGLSQLHQLRGRISRGPVSGECYLFAENASEDARTRLNLFVKETDGFLLAEEDAKLRGFGEFFGLKQHGLGELRLGNLLKDAELLGQARKDAFELVADDAKLHKPSHAELRRAVLQRYGETLDLAEIG